MSEPAAPAAFVDPRMTAGDAPVSPPPEEWRRWLDSALVPTTTDPYADLADLAAFAPAVGAARVIGLGEASHGTGDFFQLKHRLVRWLVAEHGLTSVTMESYSAETMVLDSYVRGEIDLDPRQAVTALYGGGFPWDTEEIADLVRWLREHNATATRPVGCYGFDVIGTGSAVALIDCLEGVDSSLATRTRPWLEPCASPFSLPRVLSGSPAERASLAECAVGLAVELDARRGELCDSAGDLQWRQARHHAEAVRLQLAIQEPGTAGHAVRDRSMAAMTELVLRLDGPDARVVAWAHNAHIARATIFGGPPSMGQHLHDALGEKYLVVGLSLGRGTFRAHDVGGDGRPRAFDVSAATAGSLDGALALAASDCYLVDLRDATGGIADWLAAPMPARVLFGGHRDGPNQPEYDMVTPSSAYDVMAFVRNTTAAVPVPGAVAPSVPTALGAPVNLNLAERDAAGPVGWLTGLGRAPLAYELIDEVGCVGVRRLPSVFPGGSAMLLQTIDATPLRGRRLRISARLSHATAAAGDDARLICQVTGPTPSVATTEPGVVGEVAAVHDVAVDVPDDAVSVSYGVHLVGAGALVLSSVTVSLDPQP